MKVRQALETDAEQIQNLYTTLTNSPDVKVEPSRVKQILSDDNNFLFVIVNDHDISGTCFLTLCLDPMYGTQPYGVIENIIINSESRSAGLGKELMRHVESFCFAKDCSKVMLQSNANRDEAHGFFNSLGYEDKRKVGFVKYRSNLTGVAAKF